MKRTLITVSVVCAVMLFAGCSADDPQSVVAPPPQGEAKMAIVSRSGMSPELLVMDESAEPAVNPSSVEGAWVKRSDSGSVTTVFEVTHEYGWEGDTPLYDKVMLSGSEERLYMPITDGGFEITPVPVYTDDSQAEAGLLTAGEWHDHQHWCDFQTFIRDYPDHFSAWKLNFQRRVIIKVVDAQGISVPGADVRIETQGVEVFNGTTMGDGSIAFFPLNNRAQNNKYRLSVNTDNFSYDDEFEPVTDDDQTWMVRLEERVTMPQPTLDLVFTVDVTGSMGDELQFIQSELLDICGRIYDGGQIGGLRVGFVFYRDRGDEFVTKVFPFTSDVESAKENIETMRADGGGDFPEDLNLAMQHTLQELRWRNDENCIRLCFLVADAPPNFYQDQQYTYKHALDEAAGKGVKIIPIAGSGIDKSTEYLFRHMAVRTMGRYIFLTDDSGIGGSHISPDVGDYEVETLNELIVRAIDDELSGWRK